VLRGVGHLEALFEEGITGNFGKNGSIEPLLDERRMRGGRALGARGGGGCGG